MMVREYPANFSNYKNFPLDCELPWKQRQRKENWKCSGNTWQAFLRLTGIPPMCDSFVRSSSHLKYCRFYTLPARRARGNCFLIGKGAVKRDHEASSFWRHCKLDQISHHSNSGHIPILVRSYILLYWTDNIGKE